MKDLARVLKVEENCIKVQLLDSSACINCPWQKSCTSGKSKKSPWHFRICFSHRIYSFGLFFKFSPRCSF